MCVCKDDIQYFMGFGYSHTVINGQQEEREGLSLFFSCRVGVGGGGIWREGKTSRVGYIHDGFVHRSGCRSRSAHFISARRHNTPPPPSEREKILFFLLLPLNVKKKNNLPRTWKGFECWRVQTFGFVLHFPVFPYSVALKIKRDNRHIDMPQRP